MEKRWHKISELVEAQEFTKVEIVTACLNGDFQVYNPDGLELQLIEIPQIDGTTLAFLLGFTLKRQISLITEFEFEKLYGTYDDLKNCLIFDQDKRAYFMGVQSEVEALVLDDQWFREMAERKIQEYGNGDHPEKNVSYKFHSSVNPVILNGMKDITTKFGVSRSTVQRWVMAGAPIVILNAKDKDGTYTPKTGGAIRYTCEYHRLYDWLLNNPNS